MTMKSIGARMMASVLRKSFHLWMSYSRFDMNFARQRAVANFANSAGCRRTGPSTSHEREPLMLWGLKMVAKSSRSISPKRT